MAWRRARRRRAFGSGSTFSGALDGLGAIPVGAWSVARRLTADYTGPLIRIRESGGDTEEDIGFDSDGNLDTAAATAHIGENDGFIVKVYDQVGSNDLTQSTASAQPAYLASGINSLPSADFDGTNHYFVANALAATFTGSDKPLTFHVAIKSDNVGVISHILGIRSSTSTSPFMLLGHNESGSYLAGRPLITVTAAGTDTSAHVLTWWFTGTAINMEEDTTLIMDAQGLDAASIDVDTFSTGASVTTSLQRFCNAKMSEWAIFSSSLADAPRDALRDNMISYYGTA